MSLSYTISIQTKDATPTSIISFPIPQNYPNYAVLASAKLLALTTVGTESGYASTFASAFYNGKSIISPGTIPVINFTVTPQFVISAYWQISDSALELVVKGINGKPMNWICDYSYIQESTGTSKASLTDTEKTLKEDKNATSQRKK